MYPALIVSPLTHDTSSPSPPMRAAPQVRPDNVRRLRRHGQLLQHKRDGHNKIQQFEVRDQRAYCVNKLNIDVRVVYKHLFG